MTLVATPRVGTVNSELFTIPLTDDRYVVYAPLRRAAFVANGQMVNFISDLKEGHYDSDADPDGSLVELLRRLEIVDGRPEAPPVTTFHGDPQPTTATLFLTTACNLRCTYCYASAGDTPLKSMKLDTATRAIDHVIANAIAKGATGIEVAYHGGGEPTANWSVMTLSLDYARRRAAEHGLTVAAACASNGVLRDDQIDWIIANLQGVSVSFDGLPEVHDRHRLTVTGQGSSDRVMHTLRRFDEAGFSYGVRLTVTADQIAQLPESVDFVCRNFDPKRIQVEPAYQLGRWRDAPSAETEQFIDAYRAAQARSIARGKRITYSAARVDTLTNHFCGVTQDSFAVSPDGNVSACYESFSEDAEFADVFFYAQRNDDGDGEDDRAAYRINLPVLNHLREQAVEHRDFCRGCFARWHCAGDCYHKSLAVNGRGEFRGSDRCHITRELTKDQILEKITDSGGLVWHGDDALATQVAQGKELLT